MSESEVCYFLGSLFGFIIMSNYGGFLEIIQYTFAELIFSESLVLVLANLLFYTSSYLIDMCFTLLS